MSQPDPVKNKSHEKTPWTTGSLALMVIGLLILIPAGLCTAVFGVLVALGNSFAIDTVLIVGGLPALFGAALVDASRRYRGLSSGRFGSTTFIVIGAALLIMGGLIAVPYLITTLGGTPLGGMDFVRRILPDAGLVLFLIATLILGPEPSDLMIALIIGLLPMLLGIVLIWTGLRLPRR